MLEAFHAYVHTVVVFYIPVAERLPYLYFSRYSPLVGICYIYSKGDFPQHDCCTLLLPNCLSTSQAGMHSSKNLLN